MLAALPVGAARRSSWASFLLVRCGRPVSPQVVRAGRDAFGDEHSRACSLRRGTVAPVRSGGASVPDLGNDAQDPFASPERQSLQGGGGCLDRGARGAVDLLS